MMFQFTIKIGIPIFNRTFDIVKNNIQMDEIIVKNEGKFRFIDQNICFFISRLHLFKIFRIHMSWNRI